MNIELMVQIKDGKVSRSSQNVPFLDIDNICLFNSFLNQIQKKNYSVKNCSPTNLVEGNISYSLKIHFP